MTTSSYYDCMEVKREYYQNCFIFCQRAIPSMGTVNKKQFIQPGWAVSLSLRFFGCIIYVYVHVCFVIPWPVESFPFMLCRLRNKLKWAPSSFLLPPNYCGLGAGSIPFRAIVNNKQCEMSGLFMSLVIHYWIGDVLQDSEGVSASEMTYIVSGWALNSTRSLTQVGKTFVMV